MAVNYIKLSQILEEVENSALVHLDLLKSIVKEKEGLSQKIHKSIEEIKDHKRRELNLVVAGEFSRGKSTFINALIRQQLLPINIKPTTAKLTKLRYGNQLTINVILSNGKKIVIQPDDLEKYVAEYGDNHKEVHEIQIEINSSFLKNGFCLIDTPGVNVTLEEHLNITKRAMSTSDAIIFLLSAAKPVTRSEIEFLKSNSKNVEDVFFVFNMIDKVDKEELTETISYAVDSLCNVLSLNRNQINFYPVSAKNALKNYSNGVNDTCGFDTLETNLKLFSEFKKNQLALKKLLHFISEETNAFQGELDAIFNPFRQKLSEVEEAILKLREKLLKNTLPESIEILNSDYKKIFAIINSINYSDILEEFRDILTKKVKKIRKSNYNEYINSLLKDIINKKLNQAEEQIKTIRVNTLKKIEIKIKNELEKTRTLLDKEQGSMDMSLEVVSQIKYLQPTDTTPLKIVGPALFTGHPLVAIAAIGITVFAKLLDYSTSDERWIDKIMNNISPKVRETIKQAIDKYTKSYYKDYKNNYKKINQYINDIRKNLKDEFYNLRKKRYKIISNLKKKNKQFRSHFKDIKDLNAFLSEAYDVINNIDKVNTLKTQEMVKQFKKNSDNILTTIKYRFVIRIIKRVLVSVAIIAIIGTAVIFIMQ